MSEAAVDDEAHLPGIGPTSGRSWPGVALDGQTRTANIRFFLSHDGEQGIIDCQPQGTDGAFERLKRGARIGVYRTADGLQAIKQLRVLRFQPATGWGNPTATSLDELDRLARGSLQQVIREAHVSMIGPRPQVIGQSGNDLAATWMPESGPVAPLAIYVLTRVVPIVEALARTEKAVAS